MSSSLDAGYSSQEAMKILSTKCEKSEDGKHDWKRLGSGPSSGGECKKCGACYYWK